MFCLFNALHDDGLHGNDLHGDIPSQRWLSTVMMASHSNGPPYGDVPPQRWSSIAMALRGKMALHSDGPPR